MALPYGYNKPRIVLEQSPLADLFANLPTNILSFMQLNQQLQFKADEAEKDRQFKESQLYLGGLLDTKKLLQTGLMSANKTASAKNLSLDIGLDKIVRNNPAHSTSGGPALKQDFMGIVQQEIDDLTSMLTDSNKQLSLAKQGERDAIAIDRDFSGGTDTKELTAFQNSNPELFQEFGMDGFPEAYLAGVHHQLLQSDVRKLQKEKKTEYDTKRVLDGLTKEFPTNKHVRNANNLFKSDPSSDKVLTAIGKVYDDEDGVDAVDKMKENLKTTDVTFRALFEGLQSAGSDADPAFFKGLKVRGTENYPAKSLMDPKFVTSVRRDLASNFATWFSGKTREGEKYSSSPIDWIKDKFEAADGWEDIDNSVPLVMQDPRFKELISNPEKLEEAFDWTGFWKDEVEEEAANNFFLKAVEAYELIDTVDDEGAASSPELYKKLKGMRDESGVPADTTGVSIPADTIGQRTIPVDISQTTGPTDFGGRRQPLRQEQQLSPMQAIQAKRTKRVTDALGSLLNYGARSTSEEKQAALLNYQQTAVSEDPFSEELFSEELYPGPVNTAYDDHMATLIDLAYIDPNVSSELSGELGTALDSLRQESQVKEVADIIVKSPNIRREFESKGDYVDVISILEEWKKQGFPDIGEFLMDEFPDIEPEFIR